jgi:hypothetical protein
MAMEEGLLSEDLHGQVNLRPRLDRVKKPHHRGKHATQTPHVETVVVFLIVYEQLWSLEIPRSHANVVFCLGVVELCETPINETQLYIM